MEVGTAPATVKRMEKVSHLLVVDKFSLRSKSMRRGDAVKSDEFLVAGKPWTIRFYPVTRTVCIRNESKERVEFVGAIVTLDQGGFHHGISSFRSRPSYRLIQYLDPGKVAGAYEYIRGALSELHEYGFCNDDCLKIQVTIGVFTNHHDHIQHQVQPHLVEADDFGMKLERKLSDDACVIFEVASKKRYYAHVSVLAARCPALVSLSNGDHHRHILLLDMEPNLFEAMLWFIYNGALPETDQEAVTASYPFNPESFAAKMLAAADQYELQSLKNKCQSLILKKKVSRNSLGNLLRLAEDCHSTELKSACLKFAVKNNAAYLEEKWPLLFLELSACKDDPAMSGEGILDICRRVFSTLKESVGWSPNKKKHKIKSV